MPVHHLLDCSATRLLGKFEIALFKQELKIGSGLRLTRKDDGPAVAGRKDEHRSSASR